MAEKTEKKMKLVPAGERKCIWMEAGAVSYKLCANNYNCSSCQFDHAMSERARKEEDATKEIGVVKDTRKKEATTWVKEFKKLPAHQRKCRYMATGEVAYKICPNAFRCGECSYDQMMQDRIPPVVIPQTLKKVAGYVIPDDYYFHRGHSWTHMEYGGRIRVGMDDFAQRLVGSLTGIELPQVGEKILQGSTGWTIERDSRKAKLLSPMDGIITAVNVEVEKNPALINQDPYGRGWIYIIEPLNLRKNLKDLLYGDDAQAWMEDEASRLLKRTETEIGATAADGGRPVSDIFGSLEGEEWTTFIGEFLLTK
jgi:glycine cleavage system H lipoate-binding protein